MRVSQDGFCPTPPDRNALNPPSFLAATWKLETLAPPTWFLYACTARLLPWQQILTHCRAGGTFRDPSSVAQGWIHQTTSSDGRGGVFRGPCGSCNVSVHHSSGCFLSCCPLTEAEPDGFETIPASCWSPTSSVTSFNSPHPQECMEFNPDAGVLRTQ